MDDDRARELLASERRRVEGLLSDLEAEGADDRAAANAPGDMFDSAQPLTEEGTDASVAAELRRHLEAIGRAEARLVDGTFGRSVRSGEPIADDRLEADPTAELTVRESAQVG